MGLADYLEGLPGAMRLTPLQISSLSPEECMRQLAAEGVGLDNLDDAQAKLALERALGRRYCRLFLPGVALGLLLWAVLAAVLPTDGPALAALALVPAPFILILGAGRRPRAPLSPTAASRHWQWRTGASPRSRLQVSC